MSRTVLVVAASHRRRSNSAAIGRYLADALANAGVPVRFLDIAESGGLQGDVRRAVEEVPECQHVVLVASLYHDAINALATATLEAWADAGERAGDRPLFSAIVHSGYPEPVHTEVALAICRRFADEVGWAWRGGLTAGATSPIGGKDLRAAGPMTRNLCRALDLMAQAFARGEPVPEEAVRNAARVAMPRWLYIVVGNRLMQRQARRMGTPDLDRRPYVRGDEACGRRPSEDRASGSQRDSKRGETGS